MAKELTKRIVIKTSDLCEEQKKYIKNASLIASPDSCDMPIAGVPRRTRREQQFGK